MQQNTINTVSYTHLDVYKRQEYTNRTVDTLEYDYILLDIDNAESAMNFGIDKAVQNFFVTSFDTYDIRRGLEILNEFPTPIKMTKILFSKEVTKAVSYTHLDVYMRQLEKQLLLKT